MRVTSLLLNSPQHGHPSHLVLLTPAFDKSFDVRRVSTVFETGELTTGILTMSFTDPKVDLWRAQVSDTFNMLQRCLFGYCAAPVGNHARYDPLIDLPQRTREVAKASVTISARPMNLSNEIVIDDEWLDVESDSPFWIDHRIEYEEGISWSSPAIAEGSRGLDLGNISDRSAVDQPSFLQDRRSAEPDIDPLDNDILECDLQAPSQAHVHLDLDLEARTDHKHPDSPPTEGTGATWKKRRHNRHRSYHVLPDSTLELEDSDLQRHAAHYANDMQVFRQQAHMRLLVRKETTSFLSAICTTGKGQNNENSLNDFLQRNVAFCLAHTHQHLRANCHIGSSKHQFLSKGTDLWTATTSTLHEEDGMAVEPWEESQEVGRQARLNDPTEMPWTIPFDTTTVADTTFAPSVLIETPMGLQASGRLSTFSTTPSESRGRGQRRKRSSSDASATNTDDFHLPHLEQELAKFLTYVTHVRTYLFGRSQPLFFSDLAPVADSSVSGQGRQFEVDWLTFVLAKSSCACFPLYIGTVFGSTSCRAPRDAVWRNRSPDS